MIDRQLRITHQMCTQITLEVSSEGTSEIVQARKRVTRWQVKSVFNGASSVVLMSRDDARYLKRMIEEVAEGPSAAAALVSNANIDQSMLNCCAELKEARERQRARVEARECAAAQAVADLVDDDIPF